MAGSPAFNAGTTEAGVTTDQRGVTRPGSNPDIGAYQGFEYLVTTTAETGAGSLGQAIDDTNADLGLNVIIFGIGTVGSQQTIPLTTDLPTITGAVQIAGWSQGGAAYDGVPLIQIESGTAGLNGLDLLAGQSIINGLVFGGFTGGTAININSSGNVVEGTYVGVDAAGTAASSPQNGTGIFIASGADNNTIGGPTAADRDIISGNEFDGVLIQGNDNVVEGDYIGTDAIGSLAVANNESGVLINAGGSGNTIGGLTATPGTGAGNVISGNSSSGIDLDSGSYNVVEGDLIGTKAGGGSLLANGRDGVLIESIATGDTIGGTTAAARNILDSGPSYYFGIQNTGAGVEINGDGSSFFVTGNVVEGDYIGTDITGSTALGKGFGVLIDGGASDNTIGGVTTTPGTGPANVISGNEQYDVSIDDTLSAIDTGLLTEDNVVEGDYIGPNAADTASLGSSSTGGVEILNGASHNTIGGVTASAGTGAGDVIWGNSSYNVIITANFPYSGSNFDDAVEGDMIGTDLAGTTPGQAHDYEENVVIDEAEGNTIGGAVAGAGNIIRAGTIDLEIDAGGSTFVQGNQIGGATSPSYSTEMGISINAATGGSHRATYAFGHTVIGGSAANEGNVISGATLYGISVVSGALDIVSGNLIGTAADGSTDEGNLIGVYLEDGHGNTVGGTTPGAKNVIAWSAQDGLILFDEAGDLVDGNYIGVTSTGEAKAGNGGDALYLYDTSGSTIGGTAGYYSGNILSNSGADGVLIAGNRSTGDVLDGNLIGTDLLGHQDYGNAGDGVAIEGGAASDTIGGTTVSPLFYSSNVISGSAGYGVLIQGADNNLVEGNLIGMQGGLLGPLANLDGVWIDASSTGNTIGGTAGNTIGYNLKVGIYVTGSATAGNLIENDEIGLTITPFGPLTRPNGTYGVELKAAGANRLSGDVISGNNVDGVLVDDAPGQTIDGCLIGVATAGFNGAMYSVPNQYNGITVASSPDVTISGNLISANQDDGIALVAFDRRGLARSRRRCRPHHRQQDRDGQHGRAGVRQQDPRYPDQVRR